MLSLDIDLLVGVGVEQEDEAGDDQGDVVEESQKTRCHN